MLDGRSGRGPRHGHAHHRRDGRRQRAPRTCSTSPPPTSTDASTTARRDSISPGAWPTRALRSRCPTTLNVSSLDLLHPELVHLDEGTREDARALMEAYVAMGCRPTWTCAPYQLPDATVPRRAHRVGRVERDRVRELGAGRPHRPLRRLHRHLLRDHRPRAGGGPAPGRGTGRARDLPPRRGARSLARRSDRPRRHRRGRGARHRHDGPGDRRPAAGTHHHRGSRQGVGRRSRIVRGARHVPRRGHHAGGPHPGGGHGRVVATAGAHHHTGRPAGGARRALDRPGRRRHRGGQHRHPALLRARVRAARRAWSTAAAWPCRSTSTRDATSSPRPSARDGVGGGRSRHHRGDRHVHLHHADHPGARRPGRHRSGKWAWYAPGNLGLDVAFASMAECVRSAIAGELVRDEDLWGS